MSPPSTRNPYVLLQAQLEMAYKRVQTSHACVLCRKAQSHRDQPSSRFLQSNNDADENVLFASLDSYAFLLSPVPTNNKSRRQLDPFPQWNTLGLYASKIMCSKAHQGANPSIESCYQAWRKMPYSRDIKEYTRRSTTSVPEVGEVTLPIRYLSDDGLCAIDVTVDRNAAAIRDRTSELRIQGVTEDLLRKCVIGSRTGGVALKFSM